MSAHISPEDLRDAPRVWLTNSAGMRFKTIDPLWLRRKQRSTEEKERRASKGEAAEIRALVVREAQEELHRKEAYSARCWQAVHWVQRQDKQPPIVSKHGRAAFIMSRMATVYDLTVADLRGPRRQRDLILARHHIMYEVSRACPHLSLPQIGRLFDRDHTTVLHALRAWPAKAATVGIPVQPLRAKA